jgi:hypothetical protein
LKNTQVSDDYVANLYQSKHEDIMKSGFQYTNVLVDDLFQGLKVKALLKKARMAGFSGIFFNLFAIPLGFLRNYTIPMAEEDAWDRTRAAITPITSPLAFMYLFGLLSEWESEENEHPKAFIPLMVGLGISASMIPFSIYMFFCTKKTAPP